jgi:hypothetical protein
MVKTCNNLIIKTGISFCLEQKSYDFDCEYCGKFRVLNSQHIKYESHIRNK